MRGKRSVAGEGFGRLARCYRWVEWMRFGRRLQKARVVALDDLDLWGMAGRRSGRAPRALFLGDGDGRLLQRFAKCVDGWQILSVDVSQSMLQLQRKRIGGRDRRNETHFVRADSRHLPVAAEFDVVFAAFHLDCFPEHEIVSVVDQVHQCLADEGVFYVVDFIVPPRGWRRHWAKAWAAVFVWLFRHTAGYEPDELPDHRAQLGLPDWLLVTEVITDGWISTALVRKRIGRNNHLEAGPATVRSGDLVAGPATVQSGLSPGGPSDGRPK